MTHQDLGLGGPPAEALRRVLNWAQHGDGDARVRRRTILKVQNGSGARPLYGLFFGAACIFNGIRFFHSRVHRLGLRGDAAHLLILARFLWALARRDDALIAPLSAGIRADRRAVGSTQFLLLLVTTLDRLIMGLRPFLRRGEGPLKLTAVSARPRHLLRALSCLLQGRHPSHAPRENGYISCRARTIRPGFLSWVRKVFRCAFFSADCAFLQIPTLVQDTLRVGLIEGCRLLVGDEV